MHTKKTQEQVRSRIEGVAIVKDPPPKTHGPMPIISDEALRAAVESGASDEEIAEKYGVSPVTVKKRRLMMGICRGLPRKKNNRS